jgi:hypothetical protein
MTKTLIGYCGKLGSGKAYCMMKEVERLKTTGNSVYLISFADPIKQILRDFFGITKDGRLPLYWPNCFTPIYIRGQIVDNIYKILKRIGLDASETTLKSQIAINYDKWPDFPTHVLNAVSATTDADYDWNFRRCAQLLGTELARHLYGGIWVEEAFRKVDSAFKSKNVDYVFIDDVRFINEYEAFELAGRAGRYDTKVMGVEASDMCRAVSRGLSMDDLKAQDEHGSERDIDYIISQLPPENVINNER